MQDPFKHIPELGKFLLGRLEEFTRKSYDFLPEFHIPMLESLRHLSEEELFNLSLQGNEKLFEDFVNRRAFDTAINDLKNFYKDENPLIKSTEIAVEDFIRIYELREKTVSYFLPEFTSDVEKALAVMQELKSFHSGVQEYAFKRFIELKNAQLNYRNQMLEDAQKQAILGHWVHDFQTEKTIWSDILYEIFEVDKSTPVTTDLFLELVDEECRDEIKEKTEEAIATKKKEVNYNFSITTLSGTKKYISGRGTFDYDKKGELLVSKGVFQDISETHLQYLELEKSQYRLREAQEIAHIGSWAYFPANDSIEWSDEQYRIFGYKPSDKVSTEDFFNRIHPDDRERKQKLFEYAFENGRAYAEEYRILLPGGKEKWVRSHTKVRKDKDTGKVVSLYGTTQDITDVKIAYRKLEKSQERLTEAQHIAKIGSWEFYPANNHYEWTKEHYRLFGLKPGIPVTEDLFRERLLPEDREKLEQLTQKSIESGISYSTRFRIKDHKGDVKWLNATGHVETNPDNGEVLRVYGTTQDVTDMVEKEHQLQALNESLEQRVKDRTKDLEDSNENLQHFAYVVSHDLKAPLRAIANIVNFIVTDYNEQLDDQGREYLRLLEDRTKFMEKLIKDILEYSRAGDKKDEPEKVDLNKVVQSIMADVDPDRKVKFECDNLPGIYARFTSVYQIFQNILGNAVKHAKKENPVVKLTFQQQNSTLKFLISDNGNGINKTHFKKIFNIFETLGDEKGGSGVGLAIVKKLTSSMNGKVAVESEPGSGATFIVELPADIKE